MSAYELNQSREVDGNWLAQRTGKTVWIVTTPTPAINPATGPLADAGLPALGTQHPLDAPGTTNPCKLESYNVTKQLDAAGTVWQVEAAYSNYHSFSLVPGFYSREASFSLGTVDIPYAILGPVQWPNGTSTPAIAYTYKPDKLKRERGLQVVTIRTVTSNYTAADEKQIADHTGKFDFFAPGFSYPTNVPYKFHGAQVSHQRGTVYQLVYTWSVEQAITFIDTATAIHGTTGTTDGGIGTSASPRIVFPGWNGDPNGTGAAATLGAYQKWLAIPPPPITATGSGPYYQIPPTWRQVSTLAPSDVFTLGVNYTLPGNPQNVT